MTEETERDEDDNVVHLHTPLSERARIERNGDTNQVPVSVVAEGLLERADDLQEIVVAGKFKDRPGIFLASTHGPAVMRLLLGKAAFAIDSAEWEDDG